jgi:FAD:protein FMN transferase
MVLSGIGPTAVGNDGAALDRYEQSQVHMATVVKVVVYAPSPAAATAAADAAFAHVKELNDILSDYVEESELNRFCRTGVGQSVKLSPELFAVLERAQYWREESGGAFDVTAGPLIRVWRLARKTKHLPSQEKIEETKKLVGGEKLLLDSKEHTGQLTQKGMRIDLGGIAKGYVGDEMLKVLAKHGLKRAMIVLGGDVVCGDPPPNQKGWKVAIAELTKAKEGMALRRGSLLLANSAASTSGDANQYAEIGGKRFSHIIDPVTGLAQTGRRQTTVVAKTGIDADAMATAATVMGVERGVKFVEEHGGAGLFLELDVAGKAKEVATKDWSGLPRLE